MYASFTVDNYGKATVVFDGYTGRPSTKDNAHQWRCPQVTNHYVLDGGSLLWRLKWKEGSTYRSIAEMYASFTVDNYGKATVVFDGYTGRPSTKDNAHQWRCPQVTNKVDIIGIKFGYECFLGKILHEWYRQAISCTRRSRVQEWRLSVSRAQDFAERARVTKLDFFSNS